MFIWNYADGWNANKKKRSIMQKSDFKYMNLGIQSAPHLSSAPSISENVVRAIKQTALKLSALQKGRKESDKLQATDEIRSGL